MAQLGGDTIAAIATPAGTGGVGIIRISGPQAFAVLARVFTANAKRATLPHARLTPGWAHMGDTRLDEVLAVRFNEPHSFTGEDVAEIQAHGGRLNLQRILDACLAAGARAAGPGEFTLRAFLNGRIDLTRAEAVRDMIESQTDAALDVSRRHLSGELAGLCETLRADLIEMLALIEAYVDFPEEDLALPSDWPERLARLSEDLQRTADTYARGRLLREGLEAMIVGLPNVGKSSLLNRLLRSERAIVTDTPGTTRDMIEGVVALGGMPIRFVDTAGLNAQAEGVEAIGVKRARERLASTDLVLWVLDASRAVAPGERELCGQLRGRRGLLVLNKSDLVSVLEESHARTLAPEWPCVTISAKAGLGFDALEAAIGALLDVGESEGDAITLTSERHRDAFARAARALDRARTQMLAGQGAAELIAADLREALSGLEDVIGVTTPDEVLERIFSQFCIGK